MSEVIWPYCIPDKRDLSRAEDEQFHSKDADDLLDWSGRAENGTLVGIRMSAKDGMPTELEAWSVDGGDIENWSPLDAIQRDRLNPQP